MSTETSKLLQQLKEQEERIRDLALVIDEISNQVIVTDAKGVIEWVNRSFTKTTGYLPDEVKGQKPGYLLQRKGTNPQVIDEIGKAIEQGKSFQGTLLDFKKSGAGYWSELTITPVGDRDSSIEKFIFVSTDVTERIRKNEELLYSELRWKFAMEELGDSFFEYDIVNGRFFGSDNLLHLVGVSDQPSQLDFQSLVHLIHPDDSESAVNALFDLIGGKTEKLRHELRIKNPKGDYVWTIVRAAVTNRGNDAEPLALLGTTTDISLIKKAEEALINAKMEAEKASAYKNQFLATMSHEIRTPLNAIIGLTDLMLLKKTESELKENLDTLSFSATHLLSLINDVLDLSKIESGKIEFAEVEFNLHKTVAAVYQSFITKCRENGNTLSFEIDSAVPEIITGDRLRLIQILNNLVHNAIKFTTNGIVVIKVSSAGYTHNKIELLFEIIDSGIGIGSANQKKIFDDFVQADAGIAQRFGGTGLGLAITKKLIELQGGEIGVESVLDEGSRFFFKLQFEVANEKNAGKVIIEEDATDTGMLEYVKVLLAEDIVVNQKVALSYFHHWKAEAVCANNGAEALSVFEQKDFDVLLIDLYMPVMNGFDAIKTIRASTRGKLIPIIALTASADAVTLNAAIGCGADVCLSKPFDAKQLLSTIKKLVKSSNHGGENAAGRTHIGSPVKKFAHIDLSKIQEASLGNKAFVVTMIETLKTEVPSIIESSIAQLNDKNYAQFGREIHKLKNCLLMLGIDKLHKDLTLLEESAKRGVELDQLEPVFAGVLDIWYKSEVELNTL